MVARMEVFFLEVAAVYDMALKGYRQNLEQLHREIEERRKAEQELRNVTVELAHQRDQLDDQVRARTQELEVQQAPAAERAFGADKSGTVRFYLCNFP